MDFRTPTLRMESFDEMSPSPQLAAALAAMGVVRPTEVQSVVIPEALSGADLVAVAQTGTGKTLAFALTILGLFSRNPASRALVLAPSREMALQIHAVFEKLWAAAPLSSCVVIGGIPGNKQESQLKKKPRLIVATPGRLNDVLKNNKLLLQGVQCVVIDEADRMLDLGFAPQLKEIQATLRGEYSTMMFSATFGRNVENVASLFMPKGALMLRLADAEKPVMTLTQRVLFLKPGMKNQCLQDEINAVVGSVIVFTSSQESCEKVGAYLKEYGHSIDVVHGGLVQGHRSRVLEAFRDQKLRILVTTDLLARGLDVPSLELVINFEMPPETEDFLHRIGRTARVGRSGQAVTFVTASEEAAYRKLKPFLAGARELRIDSDFRFLGSGTRPGDISSSARPDAGPRSVGEKPRSKRKYGASKKKT